MHAFVSSTMPAGARAAPAGDSFAPCTTTPGLNVLNVQQHARAAGASSSRLTIGCNFNPRFTWIAPAMTSPAFNVHHQQPRQAARFNQAASGECRRNHPGTRRRRRLHHHSLWLLAAHFVLGCFCPCVNGLLSPAGWGVVLSPQPAISLHRTIKTAPRTSPFASGSDLMRFQGKRLPLRRTRPSAS